MKPHNSFAKVQKMAERAQRPDDYVDVHCSVFTPRCFARLMRQLADLGLMNLRCADFADSYYPMFEFYVFLEAGDDPAGVAASWEAMEKEAHDPPPGAEPRPPFADPR